MLALSGIERLDRNDGVGHRLYKRQIGKKKVIIINLALFFIQFSKLNLFTVFAKSKLEFSVASNQNSALSVKNCFK